MSTVDAYYQISVPTPDDGLPRIMPPSYGGFIVDDDPVQLVPQLGLLDDGYTSAVPLPPSLGLFVVSLLGALFFKRMRDN